ncbi:riboflavin synthase alpha chain [Candidatus Kinetoplastibacterium blastocrithidii TCC012E]|uniref:Riboflavin synthase n=1 Tax=Candidatus Kinetoplastidibacterium blastocrithidiae TCC012E TaxID=1208922 RepID=M1M164_9PROT|nr:riboflavin synthase [Candidatus Kinetoplastibacterium blastocrithidii]AFZ83207.1 riboflavin synthase subunit alpha [Candidatus Kinetoplastibacterium blastocrithidii (ex Strigomonas culicis)]AGF50021.1 riboflavin synthase alpha chain [Candidatus Kinetoplastibacterium blastocrithidii TCC012E]
MFTGIVRDLGRIIGIKDLSDSYDRLAGLNLCIEPSTLKLENINIGDSIAVNGACMTVVNFCQKYFYIDISAESLSCTVGFNNLNTIVNLETSLSITNGINGHLLYGHIDCIGKVEKFSSVGESKELYISLPVEFSKFVAYKGSIAVNGVSLTINQVIDNINTCVIRINVIPHSIKETNIQFFRDGDLVNIEIDTIARYVARMMEYYTVKR